MPKRNDAAEFDLATWTVERLEEIDNLKFEALAHPFDVFGLGPTFELCQSFAKTAFRDWDDIEKALRTGSGNVEADLVRMAVVTNTFSRELARVYKPHDKYSRRQILRHIHKYLLLGLILAGGMSFAYAWEPQGWTAFFCLVLIFVELFLCICAPSYTELQVIDDRVKRSFGRLGALEEIYISLKEAVDAGDTEIIDAILEKNEGLRKLSQLSVKFRPEVNGAR
ncbi:hypothetical protein FB45DRAFT_899187 [Roridomyces roridus]|uniref:Uncharacterized protein n=1 Tax=Roridomyces roridus TaxID=1738132 RepID=A0AAD7C6Z3_9AGAR|nr:hypothetical protein FB45DRAFT_899187 [Roridomyces roridus]